VDAVDEDALLAIKPVAFEWLSDAERASRKEMFLAEYDLQRSRSLHRPPVSMSNWVPMSHLERAGSGRKGG
jgi:hypothetical protein